MLPVDWPAPPNIRALFTIRAGGHSVPPFDSLNLGDHVSDAVQAVAANRQVLAQAIRARPVFLRQIHGAHVLVLQNDTPDGTQADACLTSLPNLACTIMVADCLPVLFTNTHGTAVAAAHAGWRGLVGEPGVGGVLEAVFKHFGALALENTAQAAINNVANQTLVWLGPCIGPKAFEVGNEVRTAFMAHETQAEQHFTPHGPGKWLADLPALARQRVAALGLNVATQVFGNDGSDAWCTVANPSKFFSHRRDAAVRGSTGRMAACIWRV